MCFSGYILYLIKKGVCDYCDVRSVLDLLDTQTNGEPCWHPAICFFNY